MDIDFMIKHLITFYCNFTPLTRALLSYASLPKRNKRLLERYEIKRFKTNVVVTIEYLINYSPLKQDLQQDPTALMQGWHGKIRKNNKGTCNCPSPLFVWFFFLLETMHSSGNLKLHGLYVLFNKVLWIINCTRLHCWDLNKCRCA